MLGPSSVMISAPATSRLRMDSAMTASRMDLYHSSGVNWDVTMVDPRGSLGVVHVRRDGVGVGGIDPTYASNSMGRNALPGVKCAGRTWVHPQSGVEYVYEYPFRQLDREADMREAYAWFEVNYYSGVTEDVQGRIENFMIG